jgi:DNA-binding MarR family transcriptional regulator
MSHSGNGSKPPPQDTEAATAFIPDAGMELSIPEVVVIQVLEAEESSVPEIASSTQLTPSDVSEILTGLRERGVVSSLDDDFVELTEKGRNAVRSLSRSPIILHRRGAGSAL